MPVAVGLSLTMPGVPVVFAGDEFGLVGADGEASRTPMPVGHRERARRRGPHRAVPRAHRACGTRTRRCRPAASAGSHVDDETVVFVRESADETILVLATKGDTDAELDAVALPGAASAEAIFGDATLGVADDGSVLLSAEGPAFAVWALPGVAVPAPTAVIE